MVDVKQEDVPSMEMMQAMLTQLQTQNAALQVLLNERNEEGAQRSDANGRRGPSIDALEKQIRIFSYRPEEGLAFDQWMERHKEIFENDFSGLEDGEKGRILLRKIDDKVDMRFRNHIRPKSPSDLKFDEIVVVMRELFGDKKSLFEKRLDLFQLKMSKLRCDDIKEFSSIVNRVYEDANISEMKPEQIKAMILLSGIDLPRYTATLFHLMSQIDDETPTMDAILKVADNYRKVYGDAHAATNQGGLSPRVNAVSRYNSKWHKSNQDTPRSGGGYGQRGPFCSRCGREEHSEDACPHIRSSCHKCEDIGHISVMGNKWNRTQSKEDSSETNIHKIYSNLPNRTEQIKAEVMMNGCPINMVVDTGSDMTIITESKWRKIGSPRRKDVRDASPKCANGTRLKLTGRCRLKMEVNGIVTYGEVYITRENLNILGRNFVGRFFRLIPRESTRNVQERYPETGIRRSPTVINEKTNPDEYGRNEIAKEDRSRINRHTNFGMRSDLVMNKKIVGEVPVSAYGRSDQRDANGRSTHNHTQPWRLNNHLSKMSWRKD